MMRQTSNHDPVLVKGAALLAVLGSVGLIVSNVWGSMAVPNHDWIADTVSDLAAGRYEYIQDIGLYSYAVGLLALAVALAHIHPREGYWTIGIAALAVTVLLVTIIGARNEYGDRDNEGVVVHIYLVYVMGVTFTAAFVGFAEGFDIAGPRYRAASYILAVFWALGAVIFFLLPTAYDGAWERGLGIITVIWVCMTARILWKWSA